MYPSPNVHPDLILTSSSPGPDSPLARHLILPNDLECSVFLPLLVHLTRSPSFRNPLNLNLIRAGSQSRIFVSTSPIPCLSHFCDHRVLQIIHHGYALEFSLPFTPHFVCTPLYPLQEEVSSLLDKAAIEPVPCHLQGMGFYFSLLYRTEEIWGCET